MHDYAGADCHLQGTCDTCPRLVKIDGAIEKVQNMLIHLIKIRLEIKQKVNSRHDRLIGRLPVEIVSMIFIFYTKIGQPLYYTVIPHISYRRTVMIQPALLLGSVCKRWRDITITTPQLWTEVFIDFSRHVRHFDVIKEWLRRSGGLPLYMIFRNRNSEPVPSTLGPIFSLLRSHAARWRYVDLSIPSQLFHGLLSSLEIVPRVEQLRIVPPKDNNGWNSQTISMTEPFRPIGLHVKNYFPADTFVRWDNLAVADMASIKVDALVHLITHGIRIENLRTMGIIEDGDEYPLPSTPIANVSIKALTAEACPAERNFLRYITLPSLRHLTYTFCIEDLEHRQGAHDVLVTFLRLSAPVLALFFFRYRVQHDYDSMPGWRDQWNSLPEITRLELDSAGQNDDSDSEQEEELIDFIDEFFRELAYDLEAIVLPNLQSLTINIDWLPIPSWSLFANIFPPSQSSGSAIADAIDVSALSLEQRANPLPLNNVNGLKRPLTTVVVKMKHVENMEESVFLRFVDIQRSGLKLTVTNLEGCDMLARMAESYDFANVSDPYAESESSEDVEDYNLVVVQL
ncbi:hypothetical protein CVT25_000206 [Psilocybe cyanescens]|uniref:Uncharacterized protein n=1 Tax=Psilocybe cyanescens TaxID=93625 RepID=A0A409XQC2_PSICY|nr:hypothetical protein CVT25_000206 [Psilocybe cyanescens]